MWDGRSSNRPRPLSFFPPAHQSQLPALARRIVILVSGADISIMIRFWLVVVLLPFLVSLATATEETETTTEDFLVSELQELHRESTSLPGEEEEEDAAPQTSALQRGRLLKKLIGRSRRRLDSNGKAALRRRFRQLRSQIAINLGAGNDDDGTDSVDKRAQDTKRRISGLPRKPERINRMLMDANEEGVPDVNPDEDVIIVGGDIAVSSEQQLCAAMGLTASCKGKKMKRNAVVMPSYPQQLWVDGLYYEFLDVPDRVKAAWRRATQEWANNTCINFIESSTAPDRVQVIARDGCWSEVGRVGGVQKLSLGSGCELVGTAMHEIGHALGFIHTQNRHDRDDYIHLYVKNIVKNWIPQFALEPYNYNFGFPYDYSSIMHYTADSSTKQDGLVTMVSRDPRYQDSMGSEIPSHTDFLLMNHLYKCFDQCSGSKTECVAGRGMPHPRNCSQCLCAAGFGGDRCEQRPAGYGMECGATLNATSDWREINETVGDAESLPRWARTFCHWHITSPPNSKINVQLTSYAGASCTAGCGFAGLEFKWKFDKRESGFRVCCQEDAPLAVTSQSNLMVLIGYAMRKEEHFSLRYRIAPST